ncbi:MAG: M15 family metallopeptidase [Synechococcus sp.]|nr:M15 family metallopeptidase [Synechococcus sp.]
MLRTREDLPVARRQRQPSTARKLPIGPVVLSVSVALGGGLAALFLLQEQLLQRFSSSESPQLIAGIEARPDRYGRLLGHFPYPEASSDSLQEVRPGVQLQRDAAEALEALLAAARADGVQLTLISGFRSHDTQRSVFFDVKALRNQSAEERAKVSAPPGFSEHSTGLAVDLGDRTRPQTNLSEEFESTPAFYWLQNNAHRYHFTLSFPRENQQGVSYEPWHWRFEGSAQALQQFESAHRFQSGRLN